jgi:hypothetical protein
MLRISVCNRAVILEVLLIILIYLYGITAVSRLLCIEIRTHSGCYSCILLYTLDILTRRNFFQSRIIFPDLRQCALFWPTSRRFFNKCWRTYLNLKDAENEVDFILCCQYRYKNDTGCLVTSMEKWYFTLEFYREVSREIMVGSP